MVGKWIRWFAGSFDRKKPRIIAIDHDDHYASYVGRTADGRQFFLTNPFVPAIGDSEGREFLAVYFFDRKGRFVEARIDDLGTRTSLDESRVVQLQRQRITELGRVEYGRIEIEPFRIERFNQIFGLIPIPPENKDDEWRVELQPGDYMVFFRPWSSGVYDT